MTGLGNYSLGIVPEIMVRLVKFDQTNKWCMHNLESVQENEMHKILWDFEI